MNEVGLENLIIGIIKQACDDWTQSNLRNIKLNKQLQNPELSLKDKMTIKNKIDHNNVSIKRAEKFLLSEDYMKMCSIPGEQMLIWLRRKLEKMQ